MEADEEQKNHAVFESFIIALRLIKLNRHQLKRIAYYVVISSQHQLE